MKQTAMMELIEILNKLKVDSKRPDCITKRTGDYRIGLDKAITEASNLLPKEREQIEEAFNQGYRDGEIDGSPNQIDVSDCSNAKIYFDQTFNQEK